MIFPSFLFNIYLPKITYNSFLFNKINIFLFFFNHYDIIKIGDSMDIIQIIENKRDCAPRTYNLPVQSLFNYFTK